MSNIVGLDLNVDQNYLAEAVQQSVMLGIAESLNGKNEIVSQIVNSVLNTKVNEKGCISNYSSDNKFSLLEYYVRNLITDVVREEMKTMVEEKRPEISKMIRQELQKKVNYEKFTDRFIDTVSTAIDTTWCPKINVEFTTKEDMYY